MNTLIIEHAPGRAEGILEAALKMSVATEVWKPYQNESFPNINAYNGVVVGGGPMSVHEINEIELLLIDIAVQARKPIFGICLGAQLLAHRLGGKIKRTFWRKGFMSVSLADEISEDQMLKQVSKKFPTFQHHQDEIVSLPDNAIVIFTSDNCKVEGFRILGLPIWAVQFHPEIKAEKAKRILGLADKVQLSSQEKLMLDRTFENAFISNDKLFTNFFNVLA